MSSAEAGPQSEQKDFFFFKEENFLVAGRSKKVNFVLFSFQPLCTGLLQQPAMKESTGQSNLKCIASFKGSITSSLPAPISIRVNADLQF